MKTNGFSLTRSQIWNYLILFFFTCAAGILSYLNTAGQYNASMAVLVLAVDLHSCFKVKHNWYLLIIYGFIFYSNYSICMANYIAHIDDYFTAWRYTQTAVDGLYILLLFSLLLNLIAPHNKPDCFIPPLLTNNRHHLAITVGILFLLVCIGIFSFSRPDIAGERGTGTALYEYSIVGFIIAAFYMGKSRFLQLCYITILLAMACQNFLFGGRVESIQLLLILVFVFATDKLKFIYVLPVCAGAFILLTGIGQFRANFSLNTKTLSLILDSISNNWFTLDTAYSAYFTSLTFLATLSFTPWGQRLYLLSKFLLYIPLGSKIKNSSLAWYTTDYFMHYGGGVLPFWGYFYLGIIGLLVVTYYLWFLFKKINTISASSSGFWRCASLYLTVTVFRWYLYSPVQITRGFLLFSICYLIAHYAYKCLNFKPVLHTEAKV